MQRSLEQVPVNFLVAAAHDHCATVFPRVNRLSDRVLIHVSPSSKLYPRLQPCYLLSHCHDLRYVKGPSFSKPHTAASTGCSKTNKHFLRTENHQFLIPLQARGKKCRSLRLRLSVFLLMRFASANLAGQPIS